MPVMTGSVRDMVHLPPKVNGKPTAALVMSEMLQALDYLAFNNMWHGDITPSKILYHLDLRDGKYTFQLSGFGITRQPEEGDCLRFIYSAPEVVPGSGHGTNLEARSPKMDVWSLFVVIASIEAPYSFAEARRQSRSYCDFLPFIQETAKKTMQHSAPMVRMSPAIRASAAQILIALFSGRGLTTPFAMVEPLRAEAPPDQGEHMRITPNSPYLQVDVPDPTEELPAVGSDTSSGQLENPQKMTFGGRQPLLRAGRGWASAAGRRWPERRRQRSGATALFARYSENQQLREARRGREWGGGRAPPSGSRQPAAKRSAS